MASLPLTRDLIADPANYRLALMIASDAIDVVVRRVAGEEEPITAHIALQQGVDLSSAVEEAIYANPLLPAQLFNRVDIILRPERFQLLDAATAADGDAIEALAQLIHNDAAAPTPIICSINADYALVALIPPQLARFIRRTFDRANILSHLSPLASYFGRQSRQGNCEKLYAVIHGANLDLLAFTPAGLVAANSYRCPDLNDAAYFILALAKSLNFNLESDHIIVAGDSPLRASLLAVLRKFVANALPAIVPADASAVNAPLHLQILPLCE